MALELNGTTGVNLVQDGTVTAADLASTLDLTGKTVTLPAGVGGKVLQVISSVKTDSFFTTSGGSGSWLDIPGQGGSGTWSVSITPAASTSKILLLGMLTVRGNYYGCALRFLRNGSAIALGDSVSNTFQGTIGQYWIASPDEITYGSHLSFLDSPSTTSSVTYKIQVQGNSNGTYIGRTIAQTNIVNNGVYPSSLIAIEVAA